MRHVPPVLPVAPLRHVAPVVLARRPLAEGVSWSQATSYFGGAPRIGRHPWPRDREGRPLAFAAQVDLCDLAAVEPGVVMPREGVLAFFVGSDGRGHETGAVLHVPAGERATPPPPGTRKQIEHLCYRHGALSSIFRTDTFPYWPLVPERLDIDLPSGRCSDADLVAAAVGAPDYALQFRSAAERLGAENVPAFWYTAHLFARQLENALAEVPAKTDAARSGIMMERARTIAQQPIGSARKPNRCFAGLFDTSDPVPPKRPGYYEEKLAAFARDHDAFAAFCRAVRAAVDAHPPWAIMTEPEREVLQRWGREARERFDNFVKYEITTHYSELEMVAILALARTGDARLAHLPAALRAEIDTRQRVPARMLVHQMFGLGVSIQAYACENLADKYLLAQLVHDALNEWDFGDLGAFQFWIRPQDLRAGRFDRVEVTFENH